MTRTVDLTANGFVFEKPGRRFFLGIALLSLFPGCGKTTLEAPDDRQSRSEEGGASQTADPDTPEPAPGSGGATGTAGASSGGGSAGGTGGTTQVAGDGVVGTVGDACANEGALGCAGYSQKMRIACAGGEWVFNGTCDAGEACDTRAGSNQGTCASILPECEDLVPGQSFCQDEVTLRSCGADLVSVSDFTCLGSCYEDVCDDRSNYCPGTEFRNCGTECRSKDDTCAGDGCVGLDGFGFSALYHSTILRTADYAGTCDGPCDGEHAMRVHFTAVSHLRRRVRTSSPWNLVLSNSSACSATAGSQCVILEPDDSRHVFVLTDDPSAPETNVFFDVGALDDSSFTCP